jgi:hypothetical protein
MGNAGHKRVGLPGIFLTSIAVVCALVQAAETRDRWKLADDGSCYWDSEDSGPDQCAPSPGRFKLDANGGCYFDANDSGPNQCAFTLQ